MTTCSDLWHDLPAWGTAPRSRFWVALEQPGAWGAKALTQSDLDPEVGSRLGEVVEAAGGHISLVRRPGSHARAVDQRTVLVAGGTLASPWVVRTTLADPAELVRLLEEWTSGDVSVAPAWAEPCEGALLVCTNGKRDQCCAIKARPVMRELGDDHGDRLWESSHLHGHRFATTALSLPSLQVAAGLDAAMARELLASPTPLPLGREHDRGRCQLDEPQQVADAFVRAQLTDKTVTDLSFAGPDADGMVEVTAADGSSWRVRVTQQRLATELPKSCGKAAEPAVVWQAETA